jgi:PhzF family phenazine biosynthesis protein
VKLPLYQVAAFTSRRFGGNPAAVVVLDEWLDDALLQAIALESNLSETAYVLPARNPCPLRCEPCGDRVAMAGRVDEYLRGEIEV